MRILRNQTISVFDISKQKFQTNVDEMPSGRHRGRALKRSHYNYLYQNGEEALLWNTASDACAIINGEELRRYQQKKEFLAETDFDALLYDLGFYVDADLDEVFRIDFLRKRHAYAYPENGHIDVEILPTQTCNARCFYCFEQEFATLTMDDAVTEEVIRYLGTRIQPWQNVGFIWFGGEPLAAAGIIDRILTGVNDRFHGELPYTSSVTTNNSLLTDEILERFLGLWRVNDVMTTIDGYREEHDRRKAYVDSTADAYGRTLQNLSRLLDAGIHTTCRVNLDKDNFAQLDDILGDLERFAGHPQFGVQVTTLRNKTSRPGSREKYFAAEEYPAFYQTVIPKLFSHGLIADPLAQLPVRDSSNCIACAPNKIVINANGKLFECVQDSLADDNSVGDCRDGARSNYNYTKWYREMDDLGETCETCIYLPCCQGGCKHYRLSPTFDTTPCFRKKFYVELLAERILKTYGTAGRP